jgi:hypothetical protein
MLNPHQRRLLEARYSAGIMALMDDPSAYADLLAAAATDLAASRLLFHVRLHQAATDTPHVPAQARSRAAGAR